MKVLQEVIQSEVLDHWKKVEASDGDFHVRRGKFINQLVAFKDLMWYEAIIEDKDVDKLFIISSGDWISDGFCNPDFKLTTAVTNYKSGRGGEPRFTRIKGAEQKFQADMASLDSKFILVSDKSSGPYTIMEGNKRSVALTAMDRIIGIQVYLGISPAIRGWCLTWFSYH